MKSVGVVGRNKGLHAVLLDKNKGLVKGIEGLPVVFANGSLKVRQLGHTAAALDTGIVAGMGVDPKTDDASTSGSESLDILFLLVISHALNKVVAGAAP